MKKIFLNLFVLMLLGSGVWFASCSDDDPEDNTVPVPGSSLEVTQKAWNVSAEADQYAVAVFGNVAWKASVDADWCTLDKKAGEGNSVITVNVLENTTGTQRVATLTVKADNDTKLIGTFKITQEAGVLNITSDDRVEVPAEGQTVVIDVEANMDYTFEMGEWVKAVAAPAASREGFCAITRSKITLNIAPNMDTEARACNVVIKVGTEVKKTVYIEQAGKAAADEMIQIDITDEGNAVVEMVATGGWLEAKVKANISYDCQLSAWMSWDGQFTAVDSTLENQMRIRVMPNLESDRYAILKFTWKEGGVEKQKEVKVAQKAVVFSLVTETEIPCAGGDGKVVLHAEPELAESMLVGLLEADGVVIAPLEGNVNGFGELKVIRAAPNYLASSLEVQAIARFRYKDNEPVLKVMKLKQAACPKISLRQVEELDLTHLPVDAGVVNFTVVPPFEGADWEAEIYTMSPNPAGPGLVRVECSWATVERTTNGFRVNWEENTEAKQQKATVRVYLAAEESNSAIANLTQDKAMVPVLTVNDLEVKDSYQGSSIVVTFEPEEYWCMVELTDGGGFVTLPAAGEWTRSAGTLMIDLAFEANTSTEARTAIFKVSLYKKEGDVDAVQTKSISLTQAGKPAVTQITATVSGSNKSLPAVTDGRPAGRWVMVKVIGAALVDWYHEDGRPADWLYDNDGDINHNVGKKSEATVAAGTYTLYAIPRGETFDVAKVANYGKVEGLIVK